MSPHRWHARANNHMRRLRCAVTAGNRYEETAADQSLRIFWECQTFESVEQILNAVILNSSAPTDADLPVLIRNRPPKDVSPSILCLFSALFESTQKVTSNDSTSPGQERQNRKRNFRFEIAYRGSHFCGYQTQPNNDLLPSVQQSLEEWLVPLSHDARVDIRASGRTDAGVHALGQVCRFRTRLENVTAEDVLQHINDCPLVAHGSLKCLRVTRVPDSFHPTFGCTKRAYVYVMDPEYLSNAQVERLNHTLQQLEGKELDYVGLSYGKAKTETTLCTLELCRASLVTLSWSHKRLVCVELVGDRFLRRMVRILVSTALRQVLSEEDPGKHEEDALIHLIETRERKLAARAAPPFGLIFVSAQVT